MHRPSSYAPFAQSSARLRGTRPYASPPRLNLHPAPSQMVLCSPQIRAALRRMIESSVPQVAVMAYNEIVPDVSVEAVGLVGLNG